MWEDRRNCCGCSGLGEWRDEWMVAGEGAHKGGNVVGGARRGNAGSRKVMQKQKVVRSPGEESRGGMGRTRDDAGARVYILKYSESHLTKPGVARHAEVVALPSGYASTDTTTVGPWRA